MKCVTKNHQKWKCSVSQQQGLIECLPKEGEEKQFQLAFNFFSVCGLYTSICLHIKQIKTYATKCYKLDTKRYVGEIVSIFVDVIDK